MVLEIRYRIKVNIGLTYKRPEEATVVLEYDGGEDHGEGRRREEDGRGIPQG